MMHQSSSSWELLSGITGQPCTEIVKGGSPEKKRQSNEPSWPSTFVPGKKLFIRYLYRYILL